MDTMSTATSLPGHRQPSTFNEFSMQQSLLFADSLKDLKKLRNQLYSAAEYFELSYTNDDQKQIVVDTLKDYAIKALVNTVDHLGSVSCKVNDLLDEKVEQVSETEFRVSCIEQRFSTCQEYIDREGIAQQSSVISTPKYHKRYVLPAGETMNPTNNGNLKKCSLYGDDEWHHFRSAIRATIKETPSSLVRKGRTPSPSARLARLPGTFAFTGTTPKKETDKRSVSPHRFPLLRSGSLATRATTPKPSRPTTPNPAVERQGFQLDARKSASMRITDDNKERIKNIERQPSKSKRLLKSLLSRRKSKKDETLFTYLDEY